VVAEHAQPDPTIDTSVNPDGKVSVTVTVPLVGPLPVLSDTVTVYAAFCCPSVKLPECIFLMEREGGVGEPPVMIVGSLAFAVVDPPPDTLTWFTSGEVALAATLTVTVIAG
jgi:hypothetical protein